MQRTSAILIALTGALAVALATSAAGQEPARKPRSPFTSMINVDALVDNYARLVARKYDLSEEQSRFTREYVREKTHAFLDQHESELFSLVDTMLAVRTGAEMSPEELMAWGSRALPIYDEAKELIVSANDEWRGILTDEQRLIHDADVELMHQNFALTEQQLTKMVAGEMTVEEFRHPPRMKTGAPPPPKVAAQPGKSRVASHAASIRERVQAIKQRDAVAPAAAETEAAPRRAASDASSAPTTNVKTFESDWEKYVRRFIAKYELNNAQTQKALTILKSCQDQANQHLRRHQTQLARIDEQLDELKQRRDEAAKDERERLEAQRRGALEPLDRIFEMQLKPRLDKLPTRDQRKAAGEGSSEGPAASAGQESNSD